MLESVLHSWKSFTAKELKRLTGNPGPIWQEGYWDRMVRNERHLDACRRYIRENPAKARLRPDEFSMEPGRPARSGFGRARLRHGGAGARRV